MEMASGVPLVWARRDGAGVVVAAVVPGVAVVSVTAVVASALSVLTAMVPVDVAVLSSRVSAVAFVSVPLSGLSVSLFVSADCACCSVVA